MAGLRTFSADVEALAAEWRQRVETDSDWKPTGNAGDQGGEAAGYFITSGTLNGYAKPSKIDANLGRAAHEKIAADLAYDIGLPLVPVLLHRWPGKPPRGDQPHIAISLFPFLNVYKWQTIEAAPTLCQQMKLELRLVASALVPFDTWLDNTDRPNAGNFLVSKDTADPGALLRVSYIDYANSMMCEWTDMALEAISRQVTSFAATE